MTRDAYQDGLDDGRNSRTVPDARAIQDARGYDGEETVRYLNGVLDGLAEPAGDSRSRVA